MCKYNFVPVYGLDGDPRICPVCGAEIAGETIDFVVGNIFHCNSGHSMLGKKSGWEADESPKEPMGVQLPEERIDTWVDDDPGKE